MGLRSLLFALVMFGPAALAAEAFIAPLADKAQIYDIQRLPSGSMIAVGERGIILALTGDGEWQQQQVPVDVNLLRVVAHGDDVWALGHEQTLLHRYRDGTWQVVRQIPDADRPLFDIAFTSDEEGIAVGAYGLMLQTHDGGQTWQPRHLTELLSAEDQDYLAEIQTDDPDAYSQELESILPHFNAIAVRGQHVAIAGEAGLLSVSHDGGQRWTRLASPYPGSYFTVTWLSDDSLVVAGLRGHLFQVSVTSEAWQPFEISGQRHVNRIEALNDHQVIALTNGGTVVLQDVNSGAHRSVSITQGPDLFAAAWVGNELWLASSSGVLNEPFVLALP